MKWGRFKREALSYLKDRVIKKIHGWKTLFLNNAGKETLMKVIITTILTYVMTLFRLTKTWCEEIVRLIASFWWNRRDESRRIHWGIWSRMTLPKDMRGMGFRNL